MRAPPGLDAILDAVFADAPELGSIRSWDFRQLGPGRTAYWIGCRGGAATHVDDDCGRWQHQLVVRNDGWAVVGADGTLPAEPFTPGTAYLLDSHAPHAVVRDGRVGDGGPWFVAVGLHADGPIPPDEARRVLERFRDGG